MNYIRTIAALCFLLIAAPLARAQNSLIVSDGFTGTPGSITGQYGGYGWQYAVNWTSSSTTSPNQVTAGSLTFSKNGQTLTVSGNKLTCVGTNVGAYRSPPTTYGAYGGNVNQELWISFLAANTTANLSSSYAGLSLFNATEQFFIGAPQGTNGYGFQYVTAGNSDPSAQVLNPSFIPADTQTHFIVAHLSFTASGTTEVRLYVDPTPGIDAPDAAGNRVPTQDPALDKVYTSAFQFNQFRFQSGPDAHAFNFDELRMGSTYLDVAPATGTAGVVGAPSAHGQTVTTSSGHATPVTLSGSDTNSPARALTYTITAQPAHGALTGTAPNVVYTSVPGYVGADSFAFKVNNGTLDSAAATVVMTVNLASISGTVILPGRTNMAAPLTFTLRLTPSGGSVITQTLTPNTNGSFTLTGVPAGTYTLGIKGAQWLRKDMSVTTMAGSITVPTVTLLAGDINGDNQVAGADLARVRAAYGSVPGMANWNALADLNGDGQVSAADLGMVRANYGKIGDP